MGRLRSMSKDEGTGRSAHQDRRTVSTLDEYMRVINKVADSDAAPPNIFRGQQQDWPLLPRLARLSEGRHLKGELLVVEQAMLREFTRQARVYVANEQTTWDWLALAQHHGMVTRLLDWTENPLLALWFAVQKESFEGQPGVVWIFHPSDAEYVDASSDESPFSLPLTRVLLPRHSNARLHVQAGRFTVHHFRSKKKDFLPLENNRNYGKYLERLYIDSRNFSQIRCDLDRCGINAGTMFPDLTGLAQHVEWQFSLLDDERDSATLVES